MSRIELQAWLPSSDLSGAPDATFSPDDQLTDAGFNPVLWGEGDGFIELHADHPDTQYLQRRGFIRAIDTASGDGLFWWILEEASVKLNSAQEQAGKTIRWDGRGMLYYLDRYKLGQAVWAPGQPYRGSLNVQDNWTWVDQSMIAILTRFMEEGQNDTRADFLDKLDYDFSRTQDSNGNTPTDLTDYQVLIRTGGLQLAADAMRQGTLLQVFPDSPPVLQAFRALNEYRTDRSSATFASGKVRFQAGINVVTELPHKIAALRERSHTLTKRGDGQYATEALNGSGEPYMDFLEVPWTSDPDAVEAVVGQSHLNRQKQSTVAVVRHKIGPGGASGAQGYMPGPGSSFHYWLGDLVTIHTGSGEYDLDEQALEVAGIRYFLRGADWMVEAQLGAQVLTAAGSPVAAAGVSTVVNRPGPHICRTAESTGLQWNTYQDFGTSAAAALVEDIEFPATDDPCLFVFITSNDTIGTITWRPDPGNAGTYQTVSDLVDSGSQSPKTTYVYRLENPTLPVAGGGDLHVGTTARIVGVMAVNGYHGIRDSADASAAGSLVVDTQLGDLVLNIIGGGHSQADNGPTSPPAGWTVEYAASQDHGTGDSLGTWQQVHRIYADAASIDLTDLYGSGGNFAANRHHVGLVFVGGAFVAGSGAPEPTVLPGQEHFGTDSGVAACDHEHAHGEFGADDDYAGNALHDVTSQLSTTETDTDLVLKPDGVGGVEWGVDATGGGSGGGTELFVGTIDPYSPSLSSSTALTANQAIYIRFRCRGNVTVDTAWFRVGTQNGNLDIGIYDAAMNLLASTGSFACPAVGIASRAFSGGASVNLVEGTIYYLAFVASSGTARYVLQANALGTVLSHSWKLRGTEASALPLPATATPTWDASSTIPVVVVLFD